MWNATLNNYEPYINDISCYYNQSVFYTESDSAEMADIDATLKDYVQQAMAQFVTGDLDIEKDWDQYLQNLKAWVMRDAWRSCRTTCNGLAFFRSPVKR